jgi:predicted PurR-regulated permease PerM
MNFSPVKRKALAKWIIGIAAVCILIFLGVQNIDAVAKALSWCADIIMPLLIGCVIAAVLNVPMRFFELHIWRKAEKPLLKKLRRPAAFMLALLLIIGIIAGVGLLVIPALADAIEVMVDGITGLTNQLNTMNEADFAGNPFGSVILGIEWDEILASVKNWFQQEWRPIVENIFSVLGTLIGGIVNFFIAFIFAVYILFSKEKLKQQMSRLVRAWIPERFGNWLIHAASTASMTFRNFISGQSIEAVILGTLCMAGMLILQIPYAPMIGALVGVTALIPVVGAFIGTIVGALMILTVDPLKALEFIIFFIILQQIEGNVIYPKVMGSKIKLPGIWVLAAVIVGGNIGGLAGMFFSVPIVSVLYILIKEATQKRELRQREVC